MKIKNAIPTALATGYIFLSAGTYAFADVVQPNIVPPGNIDPSKVNTPSIIAFVINAFFALGVLAALIFLLWGGFNWILSGGDKEKIAAARARMVAAVVGLVLIVLSYFILNFVLQLLGLCGINNLNLPSLGNQTAACS